MHRTIETTFWIGDESWVLRLNTDGTGEVLGYSAGEPKPAEKKERERIPCSDPRCHNYKIRRWLFIRWMGTPKPVRWWKRLRKTLTKNDQKGCGCIYKLKILWLALRM